MLKRWLDWRVRRNKEKLRSPLGPTRLMAAATLARLGQPEWSELVRGDPQDFRRLGQSHEPWVYCALVAVLSIPHLRGPAIRGLAVHRDQRAIKPILKAMEDVAFCRAGAKALAKLGQPEWEQWIRGDAEDIERLASSGFAPAETLAEELARQARGKRPKKAEKNGSAANQENHRQQDDIAVKCSQCGAKYTLGRNAVVASMRDVLGAILSSGGDVMADPTASPDLIAFGRVSPEFGDAHADQVAFLKEARSRGTKLSWRCDNCQSIQDYPW